ncbi:MAG: hypothetical protein GF388_06465 [Candidatus Aegiribacteria sp.]|nr:hypothetical protein [Candidatus Aegiribacteria sp.]MBD3294802.1 hypothetical protein [Candidatus Fermentibacteria bacterium]
MRVRSHPDCWSTSTWLARLSSGGELFWTKYLLTNDLLGLPGTAGEVYPHVYSLRETDEGDILACGRVAQWITSEDAMFVCLLDGETGETLWSTIHFGMSEAQVVDAVLTGSDMIVAVGSTAESRSPEGNDSVHLWGKRYPMIVLMDGSGNLLKVLALDLPVTDALQSLAVNDSSEGDFLVMGRNSSSGEAKLLNIRIPQGTDLFESGWLTNYSLRVGDEEFRTDDRGFFCRLGEAWR